MSTSMLVVLGVLLVVGAGLTVGVREARRQHRERTLARLLGLFGPSLAEVEAEPRRLVAWASAARTARTLFPKEFRALDEASGAEFPFSRQLVEGAHARWTTQWLAWEREHDLEYKRRADEIEAKLSGADVDQAHSLRALLAATEQEKLQRYQERYEQYVRIGKAIGALHDE